ncbi:hypothetical protein D3C76_1058810 [compost metagenome]
MATTIILVAPDVTHNDLKARKVLIVIFTFSSVIKLLSIRSSANLTGSLNSSITLK